MTADIDEKAIRMKKPEYLVMALAEAKGNGIITRIQTTDCPTLPGDIYVPRVDAISLRLQNDEWWVGVLSVSCLRGAQRPSVSLVIDDCWIIREKPSSKEEARQFKGYSSGRAATVRSVLVTNLTTGSRRASGTEWRWTRELFFMLLAV
ncbi:hypothetical protein MKW98_031842 [Papaver atlanticum]|uniref:Uncharacterized protein n=1 Tax=Papaver atlanticum TaxID=357466 RepID=A0AAD4SE22_9MAGN|nr:hypothetical protein MKW98_031842 [Papaver atlanticum]